MAADRSQQAPAGSEPERTRGSDSHRWLVPANAEELPALRRALSEWAVEAGLSDEAGEKLVLASYEAMANVVEHAYAGDGGAIELTAAVVPISRQARITVTDDGRWSPMANDPQAHRGRGLPLIHQLADEATVIPREKGTTVKMMWSL